MKSKIPILLMVLLVLVSCTKKPLIVKIPMTLEDRVELEKYDKIFFGGFEISANLTEPDPRKEIAHFFTNDFRQAVGWLTWLFVLQIYSSRYVSDSDTKEEEMHKHYKVAVEPLITRRAEFHGLCPWVNGSS